MERADDESSARAEAVQFSSFRIARRAKSSEVDLSGGSGTRGTANERSRRAKADLRAESIKEKSGWVWALPVKGAKGANSANDSKGQATGTLEDSTKPVNGSPLGNLGPLGTLGPPCHC